MDRQAVQSSHIRSVGYDEATHTLETEFRDGSVYRYANVPPSRYADLLAAPSKGKFLHERVRGLYPATKQPGTQESPPAPATTERRQQSTQQRKS